MVGRLADTAENPLMRELAQELRENWTDGYWWADHELLATTLAAVIGATVSLAGVYLETLLKRSV